MHAKVLIICRCFNWIVVVSIIISILSLYGFLAFYSAFVVFFADGHGYMYFEFCKYIDRFR